MGNNKAVALGEDIQAVVEVEETIPATSPDQRLHYLEEMVKRHTDSLDSLYSIVKNLRRPNIEPIPQVEKLDEEIDKVKPESKIPVGTTLVGVTRGTPFWCVVREDGFYVGINKFGSLSAAAEKVSGVRRSGLAFWKFFEGKYNGKSIKEVYKGA